MRRTLRPLCLLLWSVSCALSMQAAAEDGAPPPFEVLDVNISGVPWGVAVEGDTIYFTMTGDRFDPTETKEDGYIGMFKAGETVPRMLTKAGYLKSPKGIIVEDDFLVITDIDQIYTIDKETGKMIGYVNIGSDGPLTGLCDVARMGDRLIVTCMDNNKLYFVDTASYTFAEFVPKEAINKPSGVVWDAEHKLIYVAECAEEVDDKGKAVPSGRILSIHPLTGEVTEMELTMGNKLRGRFVGLALKDGELYFSDWSNDKRPEAIRKYSLKNKALSNVATAPMQKVADFAIRGNQLIIPAALDNKIHIANMPPTKWR